MYQYGHYGIRYTTLYCFPTNCRSTRLMLADVSSFRDYKTNTAMNLHTLTQGYGCMSGEVHG